MINWQNQNKLRNKTTRRRKRRNLSFFSLEAFSLSSLLLLLLVFHKKIWSHKNILSLSLSFSWLNWFELLSSLFCLVYFLLVIFLPNCSCVLISFNETSHTHKGWWLSREERNPLFFINWFFFGFCLFHWINYIQQEQQQKNSSSKTKWNIDWFNPFILFNLISFLSSSDQ